MKFSSLHKKPIITKSRIEKNAIFVRNARYFARHTILSLILVLVFKFIFYIKPSFLHRSQNLPSKFHEDVLNIEGEYFKANNDCLTKMNRLKHKYSLGTLSKNMNMS